jgi:hypothetical protein
MTTTDVEHMWRFDDAASEYMRHFVDLPYEQDANVAEYDPLDFPLGVAPLSEEERAAITLGKLRTRKSTSDMVFRLAGLVHHLCEQVTRLRVCHHKCEPASPKEMTYFNAIYDVHKQIEEVAALHKMLLQRRDRPYAVETRHVKRTRA